MGFMALWPEPDLEEPFLSKSHSKDWLVFIFIYFRSQPGVTGLIKETTTGGSYKIQYGSE